jgi:hypothetical protein
MNQMLKKPFSLFFGETMPAIHEENETSWPPPPSANQS